MHLLVHVGNRAVLPDEKRGVVVRLRPMIHLIAAKQQLDAGLAHERANPLAADRVVQKRKRRGRLGPDDELRAFGGGLARQRQIRVENRPGMRVIPLLLLRNVSLNQRDTNGAPLVDERIVLEAMIAPDRNADQGCRSDPNGHDRPARSRDHDVRERRADERDQCGHAEDADDARELRDRQHRGLAVPEQQPRKAAPEIRAAQLCRHPDGRREQNRAPSVLGAEPSEAQRKQRGKQRQIRDEQRGDHDADRRSSIRRTAKRPCRSSTRFHRNTRGRRRTPAGTRVCAGTPAGGDGARTAGR